MAIIQVGTSPSAISGIPTFDEVFVTNEGSNNVSVIDTTTNKVIETFPVGANPVSIDYDNASVTPSINNELYVLNRNFTPGQ